MRQPPAAGSSSRLFLPPRVPVPSYHAVTFSGTRNSQKTAWNKRRIKTGISSELLVSGSTPRPGPPVAMRISSGDDRVDKGSHGKGRFGRVVSLISKALTRRGRGRSDGPADEGCCTSLLYCGFHVGWRPCDLTCRKDLRICRSMYGVGAERVGLARFGGNVRVPTTELSR
jgi:hypothetical protein